MKVRTTTKPAGEKATIIKLVAKYAKRFKQPMVCN